MPPRGTTPLDIDIIYTPPKSAFNGLQFRRWHCRSIFVRLAMVASQNHEIRQNSYKIWPYSSSRSSKVIDLGVNLKLTCDFLLVTNSNFGRICYPFSRNWRVKLENRWIFPPHPSLRLPLVGNPLEFCDEIWQLKTRIVGVGLPDGDEIMTLAFFVLT